MLRRTIPILFTILMLAYGLSAQIDAPKLTPVPSNENQERLIREGVVLHDHKDYDGAIRKYEEALKENPDNVEALYEMGFSYSSKGDYRKSLETAYRGARYKSQLLPDFYMQIGNRLDDLGDSKKAIEIYKAGIKISPDAAMLYYNLAVTYIRIGKPEDARKSIKRSLSINPTYASSHLFLGELYYKGGYKTPALLATSHFLVLEPNSERSLSAYKVVLKLLQGGVSAGDKPGDTIITLDFSAKKDEGDFDAIDLAMGLTKAGDSLEENKGKTKAQLAVEQLDTYLAILSELDQKENKSKFVWQYYVPYFSEMKKRNYVEPFYYYISRSSNDPEVQKWLDGNFRKVNEFLSWSKQFKWARVEG